MRIRDVLADKGRRVETVWQAQPLSEIPRLFVDRNIASVVVVDYQGKALGMVSDRLFMRALAERGTTMLDHAAVDIMQSPPPSCTPDTEVVDALRIMTDQRVRHLLVLDEGRMAGIVSIGDLVKHRLREYEMESRVLREMALAHMAEG
jgi:CBS domain-containing protein